MFAAAKDALTSATARKFLNARMARYGEVRSLRIDSQRRTVAVTCDLVGESSPIEVEVGRYELEREDGRDFIRVAGCTSSRPWIAHLLEDFVEGRRFELPAGVRSAL